MKLYKKVKVFCKNTQPQDLSCVQWGLGAAANQQAKASFGPKMPSLRVFVGIYLDTVFLLKNPSFLFESLFMITGSAPENMNTGFEKIRLLSFIMMVAEIQRGFITQCNLFVRGGITKGPLSINTDYVFGKGLIDVVTMTMNSRVFMDWAVLPVRNGKAPSAP